MQPVPCHPFLLTLPWGQGTSPGCTECHQAITLHTGRSIDTPRHLLSPRVSPVPADTHFCSLSARLGSAPRCRSWAQMAAWLPLAASIRGVCPCWGDMRCSQTPPAPTGSHMSPGPPLTASVTSRVASWSQSSRTLEAQPEVAVGAVSARGGRTRLFWGSLGHPQPRTSLQGPPSPAQPGLGPPGTHQPSAEGFGSACPHGPRWHRTVGGHSGQVLSLSLSPSPSLAPSPLHPQPCPCPRPYPYLHPHPCTCSRTFTHWG